MLWWIVLAGISGWTGDDWCPTPPRPPWPWPWWLRKLIAVAGGIGCFYLVGRNLGVTPDIFGTFVLGATGGTVLAGVVGLAGGGKAAN